jgi:hypothetical protein
MTVSTIAAPVIYAGNGVTRTFSYPYSLFAPSDIVVKLTTVATGVVTTQILSGLGTYDYAVTGLQDPATGEYASATVTLNTAPPGGVNLALIPGIPALQTTSFNNAGALPAKSVEAALDRVVLATQVALAKSGAALRLPLSDQVAADLPAAALRANQVLGFDAAGNVVTYPIATLSTLAPAINDFLSVKKYGAAGDGVTDDFAAILAAMTAAMAAGVPVYFPAGTYLLSSKITVSSAQKLMMLGAARDLTILKWNNATPGLDITYTAEGKAPEIFGFNFLTNQAAGSAVGTAIKISGPVLASSTNKGPAMRDFRLQGANTATDCWLEA